MADSTLRADFIVFSGLLLILCTSVFAIQISRQIYVGRLIEQRTFNPTKTVSDVG